MTSTILLLLVATGVQGAVINSPPLDTIIGNVKGLGPSYKVDDFYQKQNANDSSVHTTSGETSIKDDELAEVNKHADEVDEKTEEIDKQAAEVNEQADEVDEQADELDKQADELDKQDDELDKQADKLYELADELNKQADKLIKQADELDDQADELDKQADELNELADKMDEIQACDCANGDNTAQDCRCNNSDTDYQTDEKHKDGKNGEKNYQDNKKRSGYPQCKLDYLPPKPKSRCCGADSVTKGYIHGGNETQLGQYPWLVYLEYSYYDSERREKFYKCGGSLISGRYVLTAAHCYNDPYSNPAVAVHVGDHYIHSSVKDCINGRCNDGDTRILIESFVMYPKYEKGRSEYDIAVIRLQEPVSFTDFVRPICLPSFDIYKDIEMIPTLYVAGWGATERESLINNLINEKRAVGLPIRDVEDCRWIQLKDKIICAGGDLGKDSCEGDSGGPLMMVKDGQFYLVGVVVNGPTKCGNGTPAVYTHVYKYVPWIYEQIEA